MSEQIYNTTVDDLRAILAEISADGHGGDLVVIKSDMIGGHSVFPISEIGGGGLQCGESMYSSGKIDDEGEGVVYIASPEMLPMGFWKRQAEAKR